MVTCLPFCSKEKPMVFDKALRIFSNCSYRSKSPTTGFSLISLSAKLNSTSYHCASTSVTCSNGS